MSVGIKGGLEHGRTGYKTPTMKTRYLFIILAFIGLSELQAQDDSSIEINGYIKNLQNGFFFNDAFPDPQQFKLVDTFLQDNLVHNRFNFRWFINDQWNFKADMRTRLFFGDLVKADPNYAKSVDNVNNDYFDLSLILLDQDAFVLHTMLDRLYVEYYDNDWEIRLGRQRINWGISTVWNPNDIFNAFAFTDFDYEERPGSDALRVKRYTGFASSVELAVKVFDTWDEATAAMLWKFNKGTYDIQLLGGVAQNELVFGGGWAGNLKNAGFKGEATYFLPLDGSDEHSFAATTGFDYAFENSLYANVGYLYNSNGSTSADVTNLFDFELSAKNLYPYRHAIFTQVSYPFTPLINGSLATIYSPVRTHALFINPTLTVSVAQNWDLDFVGQIVFNESNTEETYKSPIQALFLRLKLSY